MSTVNLSNYNPDSVPDASSMNFVLIVSEWNNNVTFAMRDGAVEVLKKYGAAKISVVYVPGSFELVCASRLIKDRLMAKKTMADTAILAFGSVVRGGTPHFDYVCQGTTNGLSAINAEPGNKVPVIFGLLTTDNMEQATDRAGGRLGNKGVECAITAIKMLDLKNTIDMDCF